MKFAVGDEVRLIRNNTQGLSDRIAVGAYGKKGDVGRVQSIHDSRLVYVKFNNAPCWYAKNEDLEISYKEIKYDPTQMGDRDDDI